MFPFSSKSSSGPSTSSLQQAAAAAKQVQQNAEAMQSGLLSVLGTLATGGTKISAIFSGIGSVISYKVLGPLSYIAGTSYGALRGVYALTKGFAEMGMTGAGSVETIKTQFATLLRGLESARQKVAEIRKFSDVTPFRFGDVAAGAKSLESLTRGALSGRDGMKLTGDAAAVAGTQFQEMAVYVGRAYDGLSSGRPIGEVMMRLQELGAVSGATRNAIEAMTESGSSFTDMWRVLESDLKRSSGAMDATSRSLEGLQSTFEDAKATMAAGFSENFLDGEKTAVESMTKAVKNLTPVTDFYGRALSNVVGIQSRAKAKIAETVTSLPGMQTALKAVGSSFIWLNTLVTAFAGARVLGGLVNVFKGSNAAIKGNVKADLGAAGSAGGQAFQMALAGELGNAAAAAKGGMSKLVSAFKTGGLTAAVQLIGNAFAMLGTVVRGAAAAIGWPIAAITALATVSYLLYDRWKENAKALNAYNDATGELTRRLATQIELIQTSDDLARAYATTLSELGQAYRDAGKAAADGNEDMAIAAQTKIAELALKRKELDRVQRDKLRQPQENYDRQTVRKEDARQTAEVVRGGQQEFMGGEAKLRDLQAQRDEMQRQATAARNLLDGLAAVREQQKAAAQEAANAAKDYDNLTEQMLMLQKQAAAVKPGVLDLSKVPSGSMGGLPPSAPVVTGDPKKYAELQERIKALTKAMEEAREKAASAGRALTLAAGSGNELAILTEKINLYKQYEAVVDALAKAKARAEEVSKEGSKATPEERKEAAKNVIDLRSDKKRLEKVAGQNNLTLGPAGAGEVGRMEAELKDKTQQAREKEKSAPNAGAEAAIGQQILEVTRSRQELELQIAETIAAAQANAYTGELKRFALARQRIALEQKEAEMKAKMIENQGLNRAQALNAAGKPAEAKKALADSAAAAKATREQAKQEAEIKTKGAVASEQAFKRNVVRQRESIASENKARQMELSGNTEGAARERDKQTQKAREKELKDTAGMTDKEAHKQARKEMLDEQRKRQQNREVVDTRPTVNLRQKADSLARIGGGGGVYGAGSAANPKDFLKRMDTIIKYLQGMHEGQQASAGQRNFRVNF
jgi:hypothetical protein